MTRTDPFRRLCAVLVVAAMLAPGTGARGQQTVALRGQVRDADTNELIPSRLYVHSAAGQWYFARSASPRGSAVEYRKQRTAASVEMHTTLSADPFIVDVPPGRYTLTAERGKEYLTASQEVLVADEPVNVTLKLKRWINMAQRGWFSGDTHVHRTIGELPNVMLAEDLNVALPLTYWVTVSDTVPKWGDKTSPEPKAPALIRVDDTHVIWPVNTEYEIITTAGKRHTLGAVFILNHRTPLGLGTPPVGPIAAEARRQGAILDLDKHSWPWSMMIVPAMNVDLFELANNHVWRTQFLFHEWTLDAKPGDWGIETDARGYTEWGWIDFGFKNYYALLDCGLNMQPTGGTASGVHPVPLGFGRVYVQLPGGFGYDAWMKGLGAGRSFVTTGPMLFVTFDGQPPGSRLRIADDRGRARTVRVTGSAASAQPLDRIELIVNGAISQTIRPANTRTDRGAYQSTISAEVPVEGSSWIAVRCFEPRPDKRFRYAHTAPFHVDVPGAPVRPRRKEVAYLIKRMQQEIARNRDVLSPAAQGEYEEALRRYEALQKTAR